MGEFCNGFFQNLQPFAGEQGLDAAEASDVAAGMGQAVDESGSDRIGHVGKNDRDRLGSLLQSQGAGGTRGDEYIDLKTNQLASECGKTVELGVGVAKFVNDSLALDIAELAEPTNNFLLPSAATGDGGEPADLERALMVLRRDCVAEEDKENDCKERQQF